MSTLPTRPLGKTGRRTSIIALGGVTYNTLSEAEAAKIVHRALDLGITYIDTANSYSDSELRLGPVVGERREGLYIASKSTARDGATMREHVETSLKRLRTDHIDCYQLHDLENEHQLSEALAPGGAVEVLEEFRTAGVIDFIGVTGHRNPEILCRAFKLYPFDSVLASMGAVHEAVRPFYPSVSQAAEKRGAAILAMKVMAYGFLSAMGQRAVHFVLSQEKVSAAVIGVDDVAQLEADVAAGLSFETPMSSEQRDAMLSEAAKIYESRKSEAWFVKLPQ